MITWLFSQLQMKKSCVIIKKAMTGQSSASDKGFSREERIIGWKSGSPCGNAKFHPRASRADNVGAGGQLPLYGF